MGHAAPTRELTTEASGRTGPRPLHFSREALDGLGCPQAFSQPPWPQMGDTRVVRKKAMNTVLLHCLGSIDGPLPESNIVRTIMEFLTFLHLKGMGVFFI